MAFFFKVLAYGSSDPNEGGTFYVDGSPVWSHAFPGGMCGLGPCGWYAGLSCAVYPSCIPQYYPVDSFYSTHVATSISFSFTNTHDEPIGN